MSLPPFERFIKNPFPGRLITFDPGQTTGYSIWDNMKLTEAGQLATFPLKDSVYQIKAWVVNQIPQSIKRTGVHIVMEEYRVYQHKTESHAHNDMHTSRLIGALETLLVLRGVPYSMCGAGLAKTFATDDKLEAWNLWQPGKKHARDAIRHAIYWYCR